MEINRPLFSLKAQNLSVGRGGQALLSGVNFSLRPGSSLAVVALRKPYLNDKTVTAFKKAVAQAAAKIEAEPEKYRKLMVQKRLIPAPVAQNYKLVRFSMFGREDGLPPLPTASDVERVGVLDGVCYRVERRIAPIERRFARPEGYRLMEEEHAALWEQWKAQNRSGE